MSIVFFFQIIRLLYIQYYVGGERRRRFENCVRNSQLGTNIHAATNLLLLPRPLTFQ